MAKYAFSKAQRYALWKIYDAICFWCGEPIRYRDVTIDHVIPEKFADNQDELMRIKIMYSLPQEFHINDYCNWVPCHATCNSSKNDKIFKPSPAMVKILEGIGKQAEKAANIEKKVTSDKKIDATLGKLDALVENEAISNAEIVELFSDTKETEKELLAQIDQHLKRLSDDWTVIELKNDIATVTDGKVIGRTPVGKEAHYTWECPFCKSYGPWGGALCLSCGKRSHE